MKIEKTARGFGRIDFTDYYNKACSLQSSSLATEDAIWLGCADARMHLTQDHVRELLPLLQRFATTGSIEPEGSTAEQPAQLSLPPCSACGQPPNEFVPNYRQQVGSDDWEFSGEGFCWCYACGTTWFHKVKRTSV